MKAVGAIAAAGAALMGAASAQSFNYSCVKGADERTIEIVSPGEVGAACDVQYMQAGVTRTPYHANNTASFCQEKATDIVAGLIADGYACGQVGGPLTAEARPSPQPERLAEPAPEPEPAPAVQPNEIAADVETPAAPVVEEEVAAVEPSVPAAAVAEAAALVAETAPPTPAVEEPAPVIAETADLVGAAPIEEPFASEPAPQGFEAAPLEPIAVDETAQAETVQSADETALLNEPEAFATRGPATLAGADLEDLPRATGPVRAGRLVGAAPDLPPPAHSQQSLAGDPAPATTPTPAAVTAAAPAQPAPTRSSPLRDPEEIIVATLRAQAAAWNEGNLQAFMDTYWRDDDLKFVSGTAITKGWSPTMKRFRERYADESGLGQLSLERTDVEMVTDDVAIVTGRFNLVKNTEASSGVFTMVMKRIGGVWRIVHDHSVGDPSTD